MTEESPYSNLFLCELCGAECGNHNDWSEEQQDAESKEMFGIDNATQKATEGDPDLAIVCDSCFQELKNRNTN